MMAYRGQKYANMLSLNFGSRREVGSKSRSVRFPLGREGPAVGVVPAPETFWEF
jgi:hypothetical protein